MSNTERLTEAMAHLLSDDGIEMDAGMIERMITALEPIADERMVMVMRGSDDSFVGTYEGFEEMRIGWADWLDSWERLRFRFAGLEDVGDNVLMSGSQVGITRHGGVEIEHPSAVVWKFRDGVIVRVEFHLDLDVARESAGAP